MTRLDDLLASLPLVGADAAALAAPDTAHLVADGHRVLSRHGAPGVILEVTEGTDAIEARLAVAPGARVAAPVHLCFGLLAATGDQRINLTLEVGAGAEVAILSHCLFAHATRARHHMEAVVRIGPGARVRHTEGHFHGPSGGMEVTPRAHVTLAPDARYVSDFFLLTGRVGVLDMDYTVEVDAGAVAEITARLFGHATDRIRVRDHLLLIGRGARGLVKTRVALEDEARAEVTGIAEGNAPDARGHMDCMEVVKDHAVAESTPIVRVRHPLAKITHEAAIGTVDAKQLETLMARGLDPEQAVEVIIGGLLG